SLQKIIDNNEVDDWRKYFISEHRLMEYGKQGFIYFKQEENKLPSIEFFNAYNWSHYHQNMYVHNFYLKYFEGKEENFSPFTTVKHSAVKGWDDSSCTFEGFTFKNIEYQILVDRKGDKYVTKFKAKKFDEQIKKILKNKLEGDDEAYQYQSTSEESTYKLIEKICQELDKLK
ncbi:MAG: hypothetical protein ACRC0A_00690, partial [Chitinophagaceae bacterium]